MEFKDLREKLLYIQNNRKNLRGKIIRRNDGVFFMVHSTYLITNNVKRLREVPCNSCDIEKDTESCRQCKVGDYVLHQDGCVKDEHSMLSPAFLLKPMEGPSDFDITELYSVETLTLVREYDFNVGFREYEKWSGLKIISPDYVDLILG